MRRLAATLALFGFVLSTLGAVQADAGDAVPVPMKRPRAADALEQPMPPAAIGALPMPAPLPMVKPDVVASPEITGTIPKASRLLTSSSNLKSGLDAISNKDAGEAIAIRDAMPQSLDRHLLTWSIARSGLSGVPSSEIARAQHELAGWPGLSAFRANSERALYREDPPASQVLSAFGTSPPETVEGAMALAKAKIATGDSKAAAAVITAFWRHKALDTATEDKVLAAFGSLLTPADHKARMDYLMYRGRISQAKRFASLGEAYSLYQAWAAVSNRASNADVLIAKVDDSWDTDPALLFVRIVNLRHKDKFSEAEALLKTMPRDPARLINTGEWWNEERIVARGLADLGKYRDAYRIVSHSVAREPTDVVDAEFHAGWFALRGLNDPKTAEVHFRRLLAAARGPISVSRAWYWLGRSAEAEKDSEAAHADFLKAANLPATFYGQLAAARLKRNLLDIRYPSPTASDRQRFAAREAVQAIQRFEDAGYGWRANALYLALADDLKSPGELALLTAKAEQAGDHHLSLQVGKIAYGRGIDVPALAFPVGVIPDGADIGGSGKALAYAIARQESAFNPTAVSGANARGLLQILPGTAKGVAARHGLAYSKDRLTEDAGYNATLGAHYLGEQIASFDGSYILTFIAYNAGPRRVTEWVARYGDPRGLPIDDVVDWIERIPFPETRNYVQRIMENYQVYKARLGQTARIEEDLRFGR
ncbi:lytic transglycosylase domain-containing protein [Rhizobium halophytocola]